MEESELWHFGGSLFPEFSSNPNFLQYYVEQKV